MPITRRPVRSISFRSTTLALPTSCFPHARDGEDDAQYSRTEWRQARLWIDAHWSHVTAQRGSMNDARASLRSIAILELRRLLNPREEQMLSAVLGDTWTARDGGRPDIGPYWSRATPQPPSPRPAA